MNSTVNTNTCVIQWLFVTLEAISVSMPALTIGKPTPGGHFRFYFLNELRYFFM